MLKTLPPSQVFLKTNFAAIPTQMYLFFWRIRNDWNKSKHIILLRVVSDGARWYQSLHKDQRLVVWVWIKRLRRIRGTGRKEESQIESTPGVFVGFSKMKSTCYNMVMISENFWLAVECGDRLAESSVKCKCPSVHLSPASCIWQSFHQGWHIGWISQIPILPISLSQNRYIISNTP